MSQNITEIHRGSNYFWELLGAKIKTR